MFQYIENLTPGQAEDVKKTIQDLFRQTCILQIKYDPVSLIARENPRYHTCTKHREFIADYLGVLGCELLHDPQENIYRLGGEGAVTQRLSHVSTKILLLLKCIYRDKIMGEGLKATVTTCAEIRKYGAETNLITEKLTAAEWNEALSTFKRHQMIELSCAVSDMEDDSPIYLYSSINILCPTVDINEVVKLYAAQEDGQQRFLETVVMEGEEESDGTAEEDSY
ncbi:MAG: DUF4194 domain-containing protein [Lachnospiraceae bacterium]|nr:DUF4194 domain-containing protein [Lachnospiraceae bacterium]